jgi:hypothetical protein
VSIPQCQKLLNNKSANDVNIVGFNLPSTTEFIGSHEPLANVGCFSPISITNINSQTTHYTSLNNNM